MPRKKVIEASEDKNIPEPEIRVEADKTDQTPVEKTSRASFYDLDFNELDKDLSPDQLREWTDIYAAYRSKSPLTGTIIGVDTHRLRMSGAAAKELLCLVVMDYRVKIIIPQTEVWHEDGEQYPDYTIRNMVGAKIDYVITNVDREGECALASRKLALGFKRSRFLTDRRAHAEGELLDCNLLVVGPKRMIVECHGFDLTLSQRDVSYTAIADLRQEFSPGQELAAKLKKFDPASGNIAISIKEVNPNPFIGADLRHPAGCTRQAIVSGSYAGGVFCRLADDTNCLCNYAPGNTGERLNIGDRALIRITKYDYAKRLIYGKVLGKR